MQTEEKFPYLLGYTTWYVQFWFIYFPSPSSLLSLPLLPLERKRIKLRTLLSKDLDCRQMDISGVCNVGTVSKATLGKLLRDRVERVWAFRSAEIPSSAELNGSPSANMHKDIHASNH